MEKIGLAVIIVGQTGTGKTTLIKSILKRASKPFFIYDINGEYESNLNRLNKYSEFKEFLQAAALKTSTAIVFEEATIFFRHTHSEAEMLDLLIRKRHTRNLILLNFHSLKAVPKNILDFCNFLVIKKTNDNKQDVFRKFGPGEIYQAFLEVQENENRYFLKEVPLN